MQLNEHARRPNNKDDDEDILDEHMLDMVQMSRTKPFNSETPPSSAWRSLMAQDRLRPVKTRQSFLGDLVTNVQQMGPGPSNNIHAPPRAIAAPAQAAQRADAARSNRKAAVRPQQQRGEASLGIAARALAALRADTARSNGKAAVRLQQQTPWSKAGSLTCSKPSHVAGLRSYHFHGLHFTCAHGSCPFWK